MWARVKGKTENALGQMAFRAQYNFRPMGWSLKQLDFENGIQCKSEWLLGIVAKLVPDIAEW